MEYPDGSTPHARARKLTAPDRKHIQGRLRDYSPGEVLLVLRWVHQSADGEWWRSRGRTGIRALLKADGFADRLEQAQGWDGAPAGGHTEDEIWSCIVRNLDGYADRGHRWSEDDDMHEAIHHGLYAWDSYGPQRLLREGRGKDRLKRDVVAMVIQRLNGGARA